MRITPIDPSTGETGGTVINYEQGIGFENSTYLYILYGEDDNWEVVRYTRDLINITTTGYQTGDKVLTLSEIELLTYS